MMKILLIAASLVLLSLQSYAKQWRNADGSKSFTAEFVATDSTLVTLKRPDGSNITFKLSKLHPEDRLWIKKQTSRKLEGSAFDTLNFGDSKAKVQEKLSQSKVVSSSLNDNLLGRTGLNGVFQTKSSVGGRHCHLYFEWTKANLLREVSLQTQPSPAKNYHSLRKTWSALIELLKILHGNPTHSLPFPAAEEIEDGQIIGTHLWRTSDGHSVLLGSARDLENYKVVVRFTTEPIAIIREEGSAVPGGPIFPD